MTTPIPPPTEKVVAPHGGLNQTWYLFFKDIIARVDAFIDQVAGDFAGLGTAAREDVGTEVGNVVQIDEDGGLPAIDGSKLTGIIIPGYASYTEVLDASGTWEKPPGLTGDEIIIVDLWGGGGGGGRGNSASVGSGGGGGGYVTRSFNASELTDSVAVTIGAGGAGATSNANAGADGENSTFGAYLTAYGGAGGAGSASGTPGNGGGGGGATSKGSGTQGGGPIFLKEAIVGEFSLLPIDYAYGGNGAHGTIGLPAGAAIYGGGGGAGSIYDPAGSSVYGGGGGDRSSGTGGGISVHGGNGGAFGVAGVQPGGGGGGCANGAAGRCIVRIVLIPT